MAARKVLRPERIAWFWMESLLLLVPRTANSKKIWNQHQEAMHQPARGSYSHERKPWSLHLQVPAWNCLSYLHSIFTAEWVLRHISLDPWSSPLYLGGVCKKLAWTTPELWISLRVGGPQVGTWLVIQWLERSASPTLTISNRSIIGNAWRGRGPSWGDKYV